MPFTQEHMLLQVSGNIGSDPTDPLEQFSFGIRFVPAGAFGMGDLDSPLGLETMTGEVIRVWGDASCGINDSAKLTTVKWNRIGTNGKYASDTTRVAYVANKAGGGTPRYYMPPQCSLAVTLRTAKTRGLGHSGRFYLPMPSFSLDPNDFQLPVQSAQAVANLWGGMLDGLAINNSLGIKAVVMSKGRNNGAGQGVTNEVTAVAVGRVIDTIRTRRGKIPEDYKRYEFGAV